MGAHTFLHTRPPSGLWLRLGSPGGAQKKSDRSGSRPGAGLPRINTHVCLDPLLKAHRLVKPSLYVYAHRGIRVCTCMASPLIPSVQLSSLYSRLYLCVCRTHGILGHVYRPYSYQYTSDSRLTDAVSPQHAGLWHAQTLAHDWKGFH